MSKTRPWEPAAIRARAQRRQLAELYLQEQADADGHRQLVGAIVEQAVVDLRTGSQAEQEDALRYLLSADGEFVGWHADVLGIDVGAVRERARALLAERFGAEAGAALWERLSRLAGGQKRRGRAA